MGSAAPSGARKHKGGGRRSRAEPLDIVPHLSSGKTLSETAALVGVHRDTVSRWSEREDVKAAIDEVQADTRAAVARRLASCATSALDALVELATATSQKTHRPIKVPPAVRRAAAVDILELGGVTRRSAVVVSGVVGVDVARLSDGELEARVAAEAARIAQERGRVVIDAPQDGEAG